MLQDPIDWEAEAAQAQTEAGAGGAGASRARRAMKPRCVASDAIESPRVDGMAVRAMTPVDLLRAILSLGATGYSLQHL